MSFSYVSWFYAAVQIQAIVCCSINGSVPMAAQRDEGQKPPFQLITGSWAAGLECGHLDGQQSQVAEELNEAFSTLVAKDTSYHRHIIDKKV